MHQKDRKRIRALRYFHGESMVFSTWLKYAQKKFHPTAIIEELGERISNSGTYFTFQNLVTTFRDDFPGKSSAACVRFVLKEWTEKL